MAGETACLEIHHSFPPTRPWSSLTRPYQPLIGQHESFPIVIYTALPYNSDMEFIETSLFTKLLYSYLTEDEYQDLQNYLIENPEAGKVVPGSGGVRKIRWAAAGRGKSGGVRIIYFYKHRDSEIWLLTLYSKNVTENIPAHVLRQIAEEINNV